MKPIIIAIVGNSGSGKTYMSEFLQSKLNIPTVVSYTTRPPRPGETEGKDHYFIQWPEIPPYDKMLAYSRFNNHDYFALKAQIPKSGICSYVIDEEGLESLTRNYSDQYTIVSVAIKCSSETLRKRGIDPQRILRDRERPKLSERYFDCVIFNNDTLRAFEEKIINCLKNL